MVEQPDVGVPTVRAPETWPGSMRRGRIWAGVTSIETELERYGPTGGGVPLAIEDARLYCREFTLGHQENFHVLSLLLPAWMRVPFCNIYAYCRWADDLADEITDPQRASELLDWWQRELDACYTGERRHPVFVALGETMDTFRIPRQPFADLLTAFRRDQWQWEYEEVDDVLAYCRCSANPVGLILLHLVDSVTDANVAWSNQLCTGLQWINFCQDVGRDWQRGRRYLPRSTCSQFGYDDAMWQARRVNPAFRRVMEHEVHRAVGYLAASRSLVSGVPKDIRGPIELFIEGGLSVADAIRRQDYDVWSMRPTLGRWARGVILFRVLLRSAIRR